MDFVTCLKNDGVIAYPTDTVYGLCCRFDSIKAMEHLREIKNRPLEKSFPIMVANVEQLEKISSVEIHYGVKLARISNLGDDWELICSDGKKAIASYILYIHIVILFSDKEP